MKPKGLDLSKASQEVRDFAVFFPDVDLSTPEGFEQFQAFRKQLAGPEGSSDVKDFQLFFPDADINTPEGYQQFLRYKAQVAAAGRKPGGGTDGERETELTPTQKRELESSGLDAASIEAQDYFLNTPNEFRDLWTRNIASSLASDPNQMFTLEQVIENYQSWYDLKQNEDEDLIK